MVAVLGSVPVAGPDPVADVVVLEPAPEPSPAHELARVPALEPGHAGLVVTAAVVLALVLAHAAVAAVAFAAAKNH